MKALRKMCFLIYIWKLILLVLMCKVTCQRSTTGVFHRFGNSLIRSNFSEQMSKCEQFAEVAQDKWATLSESLRSFMTNEQMWAIRSGCSGQMSEWANGIVFLSKSLIFSFAHKKWAICSTKFEKTYFLGNLLHFFYKFFKKAKVSLIPSEQNSKSEIRWANSQPWFSIKK